MPKVNGLTKKQRGFIKDYERTGNATEAALRNYNVKSRFVAGRIGTENLYKPVIQAILKEDFNEEDINRRWVLRGTKELAEQRVERGVALGAYKLISQILKLIDSHADSQSANIRTDNTIRTEETRRMFEAIAAILSTEGSRFAVYVESGNPGIQSGNGTTSSGNL